MGDQALFAAETPSQQNVIDGTNQYTLAMTFYTTVQDKPCVGVWWYFPETAIGGTVTAALWKVTSLTTGNLLATKAFSSPVADAWNEAVFDSQVLLDSLANGGIYKVAIHTPSRWVRTPNRFQAGTVTGNDIVAIRDGTDPAGLGVMRNGTFHIASSLTYPVEANNFQQTWYGLDVSLAGAIEQAVGTAAETDSAIALSRLKTRTAGLAAETDTALTLAAGKARAVSRADSIETALNLTRVKTLAIGTASDTSLALALAHTKSRAVGTATETDSALSVVVTVPDRPAGSTSTVSARRTSAGTATARRTSTPSVSGGG